MDLLFHSLIVSALVFGIEVWGCASYKYLIQIDKLFQRAFKYGYSIQKLDIVDIINIKDKKLWDKILANPNRHALHMLLPPKRKLQLRDRGHDYELPNIRTERFKRVFLNRCLFNISITI